LCDVYEMPWRFGGLRPWVSNAGGSFSGWGGPDATGVWGRGHVPQAPGLRGSSETHHVGKQSVPLQPPAWMGALGMERAFHIVMNLHALNAAGDPHPARAGHALNGRWARAIAALVRKSDPTRDLSDSCTTIAGDATRRSVSCSSMDDLPVRGQNFPSAGPESDHLTPRRSAVRVGMWRHSQWAAGGLQT
jgi:hypothetical protein